MKILTTAILLLCITLCHAQNPYAKMVYDSLVIYDYGNESEGHSNIQTQSGTYTFYQAPVKRQKLSASQAKGFSTKIGLKSSYGQSVASCFDPHFAAFYYKNGKVIANVEICIGCNVLYPTMEIKAQNQDPQKDPEIGVYYLGTGLSKEFRAYMKVLLTKHGFSHVPSGESIFD